MSAVITQRSPQSQEEAPIYVLACRNFHCTDLVEFLVMSTIVSNCEESLEKYSDGA